MIIYIFCQFLIYWIFLFTVITLPSLKFLLLLVYIWAFYNPLIYLTELYLIDWMIDYSLTNLLMNGNRTISVFQGRNYLCLVLFHYICISPISYCYLKMFPPLSSFSPILLQNLLLFPLLPHPIERLTRRKIKESFTDSVSRR